MGKVSVDDKMRIQTLCEQGLGYRVIAAKYPEKNWKLDTVNIIWKCYKTFQPKPNTINKLKKVLQTIQDDLPQNSIDKAILSIVKRLRACVKAGGGHFEHIFV